MVTYSDQDDYDDDGEEDFEFDAVALDVCERLSEEDDPEVVLTVNEWLTKLTEPNGRGPNELNYLKLLRCMTANRRIGRPFRRPPPTGRLWPVHVYLLRPTRSFVGGGGSVTSDVLPAPLRHARSFRCWRTASCSRGSQTHDDDGDDDGDNDGDNNDDEEDDGNQRSQVVAKEETPGLVGYLFFKNYHGEILYTADSSEGKGN